MQHNVCQSPQLILASARTVHGRSKRALLRNSVRAAHEQCVRCLRLARMQGFGRRMPRVYRHPGAGWVLKGGRGRWVGRELDSEPGICATERWRSGERCMKCRRGVCVCVCVFKVGTGEGRSAQRRSKSSRARPRTSRYRYPAWGILVQIRRRTLGVDRGRGWEGDVSYVSHKNVVFSCLHAYIPPGQAGRQLAGNVA